MTLEIENVHAKTAFLCTLLVSLRLAWMEGVRKGRGRELGRESTRSRARPNFPFPFPFQRRPRRLVYGHLATNEIVWWRGDQITAC